MKIKKVSDFINAWTISGLLIAIAFFVWKILHTYRSTFSGSISESQDVWGQFGDYVGGTLNPFLTAITFLAVLVTIALQKEELHDGKELQTRAENQKKNEEFEKTFFNLIEVRENIVEGTKVHSHFGNTLIQYSGRESFRHLYGFFLRHYKEEVLSYFINNPIKYKAKLGRDNEEKLQQAVEKRRDWWKDGDSFSSFDPVPAFNNCWEYITKKGIEDAPNIQEWLISNQYIPIAETVENGLKVEELKIVLEKAYKSFFEDKGYLIGHYFRNMHYHIKYFEEENKKGYLEKGLDFYTNLYRSHLSGFEIIMLFFNCLHETTSTEFNSRILSAYFG